MCGLWEIILWYLKKWGIADSDEFSLWADADIISLHERYPGDDGGAEVFHNQGVDLKLMRVKVARECGFTQLVHGRHAVGLCRDLGGVRSNLQT